MRELGLAGCNSANKFIPARYLRLSIEDRWELLRGLMDTDGTQHGGTCSYTTVSPMLRDGIVELVRSLGGFTTVTSRFPDYTYKGEKRVGQEAFTINIRIAENPFHLTRKADLWVRPSMALAIDRIEPEGERETICISVDSERKLYITENYIVTHNTIQALGIINATSPSRALIICPASLRTNWQREADKWLVRDYQTTVIETGKQAAPEMEGGGLVILNFDLLRQHHEWLASTEWNLMIIDEAHYLKNSKAQRTQRVFGGKKVKGIRAARTVLLTGTPMINRPNELWTALRAIDPQGLGRNWMRYHERYCALQHTRWGMDTSGASNLDELQINLRASVMIRRMKADVLTELPAKRRQIIELPQNGTSRLVRAERQAYDAHQDRIEALREAVENAELLEDSDAYAEASQRLRDEMNAAFGDLARIRAELAEAKAPKCAEHIRLAAEQAPVVVMAHHHVMVDALVKELGEDFRVVTLTGRDSREARQRSVDEFQAGDADIFIGNIDAAGVGITLTRASHVIFCELPWTPGQASQAEDRCHRIGQVNSVLVQHLVIDGSLDARMVQTIVAKQAVITRGLEAEVAVELPSKVEPAEQVAQSSRQVPEVATVPKNVSAAILAGLRTLSAFCDGARALDGLGFSKLDAEFGHKLAACQSLSPRQAHYGARLVRKYRRQLDSELVEMVTGWEGI